MSLYIPSLANDEFGPFVQGVASNFNLLADSQIVEAGENENGRYIRFGNGWRVCWRTHTHPVEHPTVANAEMSISFPGTALVTGGWSIRSGFLLQSAASVPTTARTALGSIYIATIGNDGSDGGYGANRWHIRNNVGAGIAYSVPLTLFAMGR